MAKIYETHKDFERDKLKDQARDMREVSNSQGYLGTTLFAAGWITRLYNEAARAPRGWVNTLSWALEVVGLVGMVKSWFTSHKAHDLAMQRDRLGPEHVVLPPEMGAAQQQQDCTSCAVKELLSSGSRSPREFAETPGDPALKR